MAAPLDHVAVERAQLEGVTKCSSNVLQLLVPLLKTLGPFVDHPGLMGEHAVDSIGNYIDKSKHNIYRQNIID